MVLEHARLVVDTRNATAGLRGRARIVGLADPHAATAGPVSAPVSGPSSADLTAGLGTADPGAVAAALAGT